MNDDLYINKDARSILIYMTNKLYWIELNNIKLWSGQEIFRREVNVARELGESGGNLSRRTFDRAFFRNFDCLGSVSVRACFECHWTRVKTDTPFVSTFTEARLLFVLCFILSHTANASVMPFKWDTITNPVYFERLTLHMNNWPTSDLRMALTIF